MFIPRCELQAEHYADECAALKRFQEVNAAEFTPDQWSEIRMVVKMIAKRTLEVRSGQPQHEKVTNLYTNPFMRARECMCVSVRAHAHVSNGGQDDRQEFVRGAQRAAAA